MGSRQYRNDSKTAAEGEVFIDCSFVTANTVSPTITYAANGTLARGLGIQSVTRTGVGVFTVVLTDNFRYGITKFADLEDNTGSGAYATIGSEANAGTTLPLTFTVRTWAAAGTALETTGLRVSVSICAKNSLVGA